MPNGVASPEHSGNSVGLDYLFEQSEKDTGKVTLQGGVSCERSGASLFAQADDT